MRKNGTERRCRGSLSLTPRQDRGCSWRAVLAPLLLKPSRSWRGASGCATFRRSAGSGALLRAGACLALDSGKARAAPGSLPGDVIGRFAVLRRASTSSDSPPPALYDLAGLSIYDASRVRLLTATTAGHSLYLIPGRFPRLASAARC